MFQLFKKTSEKPNNLKNNNNNNVSLNSYIESIDKAQNITKKLSDHKDYMLNTYGHRLVDKAVEKNKLSVLDWCIKNKFPYSESTIMLALDCGKKVFLEKLYDEAVRRNSNAIKKSNAIFSFGKRNLDPILIINNNHKEGNFLKRLLKKCIEKYESESDKSKYKDCLDWIIEKNYGNKKSINNLNNIKGKIGMKKNDK